MDMGASRHRCVQQWSGLEVAATRHGPSRTPEWIEQGSKRAHGSIQGMEASQATPVPTRPEVSWTNARQAMEGLQTATALI